MAVDVIDQAERIVTRARWADRIAILRSQLGCALVLFIIAAYGAGFVTGFVYAITCITH
jgi:hypothetical protein